ncbi:MAG: aquaporin family protein [Candidatus Obscuribacterales bacterium]|jgi:glycerol uptake facilitator-like aquaporin|nr:aquaporin family protein [Candidatus Obscuribacterales bacterium]
MQLKHKLIAEFLGTAFLLATVVGSGIMGERLAAGNVAIALLANTLATGAILTCLILTFSKISSHFNPAVTSVTAGLGQLRWQVVPAFVIVQMIAAVTGVVAANLMFGLPPLYLSIHERTGYAQWFSEGVATFGLITVILFGDKYRGEAVPYIVGAYITAAYWFTSSTSFANPAVTIARCLSNTFAGIRPQDVGGFVAAQTIGAALAAILFWWFHKGEGVA